MDAGAGSCMASATTSISFQINYVSMFVLFLLQWHLPELDCPSEGDRHTEPIDTRAERPPWAERMNLSGEAQGNQSSTVFGHRQEYMPASKSGARSMVRFLFFLCILKTTN